MFPFNKISYKDKQQTFFYVTYIQTYISKQQLGRKYKTLQGIVIENWFSCLSPSQKTMENILEKAFSSVLEGHNFKFFSPLSTHSMSKKSLGTALIISYFDDWNNYHLYYKETSSFLWKNQFFDELTTEVPGICDPNKSRAQHDQSLRLGSNLKYLNIDQLLLSQGSKFRYSEST